MQWSVPKRLSSQLQLPAAVALHRGTAFAGNACLSHFRVCNNKLSKPFSASEIQIHEAPVSVILWNALGTLVTQLLESPHFEILRPDDPA